MVSLNMLTLCYPSIGGSPPNTKLAGGQYWYTAGNITSIQSYQLSHYHLSAGVGRTGTFICIDNVLEQIKKEEVVDIAGAINKLRHQRMKMVQTIVSF